MPTLTTSAVYRPFNIRRHRTGLAFSPRKASALLDFHEWRSKGDVHMARVAAQRALKTLAARPELPCFGPESGHRCADAELVLCAALWASLCPPKQSAGASSWFRSPCHGHPGLWSSGTTLSLLASRTGGAAKRFLARDLNVRSAF